MLNAIFATSKAAWGLAICFAFSLRAVSRDGSLNKSASFIGSVATLLILMAAPFSSR